MSNNIIVAIRTRPLIPREINENCSRYWQVPNEQNLLQVDPETNKEVSSFQFDKVFSEKIQNHEIYKTLALPIVKASLTGINGTIFAYGQTSSGKTYTMSGTDEELGIIPLLIRNIFQSIESLPDREFLMRASYMEIYKEQVFDLLTGDRIQTLREDNTGQVLVPGLKEVCVTTVPKLNAVMADGDRRRKVGETGMNEHSSRSHCIFRLIIESRQRGDPDCEAGVTVSHLNLVDLAGSENVAQTGAYGERLKEGGAINKSLFMLGRVIAQLSDKEQFINFRDSKLTRILQNSLGGNAKTAIVCNVTPCSKDQTLSTVRFAMRAKSIENKPIVNEVLSESALLKRYAMEIKRLKVALDKERKTDKALEMEQVKEKLDEEEKRNDELKGKIDSLKEMLVVSSHTSSAQTAKDKRNRRETWAAPLLRQSLRLSELTPPSKAFPTTRNIMPPVFSFSLAEGTPLSDISEETATSGALSSSTETPESINNSASSFGLMSPKDQVLDMHEQSKITSLEDGFLSPKMLPKTLRRKRKKLPPVMIDVECQTNLLEPPPPPPPPPPQSVRFLTPPRPINRSPLATGTPKEVLRSMNQHLEEVVQQRELIVKNWHEELEDLEKFHKNELMILRKEFEEKMGEGFFDENDLDVEIRSLKKSLQDTNSIYLDVNKKVSQQADRIRELETHLEETRTENERLKKALKREGTLQIELDDALKELKNIKSANVILENEKDDFNFRLEMALEKQKKGEKYLRDRLQEAWEEIAKYEKDGIGGHQKGKTLTEPSVPSREMERTTSYSSNSMPDQRWLPVDTMNLGQQGNLDRTCNDMDEEKESKGCILGAREDVEEFLEREEEVFKRPMPLLLNDTEGLTRSSLNSQGWESMYTCNDRSPLELTCFNSTINATDASRKLSETLQQLDESLSLGRDAQMDASEIKLIRERLIALQEMLLNQDMTPVHTCQSLDRDSAGSRFSGNHQLEIEGSYREEWEVLQLLEDVRQDYLKYVSVDRLYVSRQCFPDARLLSPCNLPTRVDEAIQTIQMDKLILPLRDDVGSETLQKDIASQMVGEDIEALEEQLKLKEKAIQSLQMKLERLEKDQALQTMGEDIKALEEQLKLKEQAIQSLQMKLESLEKDEASQTMGEDIEALEEQLKLKEQAIQSLQMKLKDKVKKDVPHSNDTSPSSFSVEKSPPDVPLPQRNPLIRSLADELRSAELDESTVELPRKEIFLEPAREMLLQKVNAQAATIEALQEELKSLQEREEELEMMITDFTWKEEALEERELRLREEEERLMRKSVLSEPTREGNMKENPTLEENSKEEISKANQEPNNTETGTRTKLEERKVEEKVKKREANFKNEVDEMKTLQIGSVQERSSTPPSAVTKECSSSENKVAKCLANETTTTTDQHRRAYMSVVEDVESQLLREKEDLKSELESLKAAYLASQQEVKSLSEAKDLLEKEIRAAKPALGTKIAAKYVPVAKVSASNVIPATKTTPKSKSRPDSSAGAIVDGLSITDVILPDDEMFPARVNSEDDVQKGDKDNQSCTLRENTKKEDKSSQHNWTDKNDVLSPFNKTECNRHTEIDNKAYQTLKAEDKALQMLESEITFKNEVCQSLETHQSFEVDEKARQTLEEDAKPYQTLLEEGKTHQMLESEITSKNKVIQSLQTELKERIDTDVVLKSEIIVLMEKIRELEESQRVREKRDVEDKMQEIRVSDSSSVAVVEEIAEEREGIKSSPVPEMIISSICNEGTKALDSIERSEAIDKEDSLDTVEEMTEMAFTECDANKVELIKYEEQHVISELTKDEPVRQELIKCEEQKVNSEFTKKDKPMRQELIRCEEQNVISELAKEDEPMREERKLLQCHTEEMCLQLKREVSALKERLNAMDLLMKKFNIVQLEDLEQLLKESFSKNETMKSLKLECEKLESIKLEETEILSTEIKNLQNQVEFHHKEFSESEVTVKSFQNEVVLLQTECVTDHDKVTSLEKSLAEVQNSNQTTDNCKEELTTLRECIKSKELENDGLKNELGNVQQEIEEKNRVIKELKDQVDLYEKDSNESKASVKNLENDLSLLKTECQHYCAKVNSLEDALLMARNSDRTLQLEEELLSSKEAVKTSERQNDILKKELRSVEAVVNQKETEIEELRNQVEQSKVEATENEITVKNLENDIACLKAECQHYYTKVNSLERSLSGGTESDQNKELVKELSLLRESVEAKEREKESVKNDLINLKQILEKKNTEREQYDSEITKELSFVKSSLEEKSEELREANETLEKLQRQVQSSDAELRAKETQYSRLKKEIEAGEEISKERLNEIEELSNAKSTLESSLELARNKLTSLEFILDNNESEKRKLKEHLASKENDYLRLASECEELKSALDEISTDKNAMAESLEKAEDALQRQTRLLKTLEKEKLELIKRSNELSSNAERLQESVESERIKLEEETQKKWLEVKEKEKQLLNALDEERTKGKQTENELETTRRQLEESSEKIHSLKAEFETLSTEVISIKGENESLSNKIISIKGENEFLSNRITSIKGENESLSNKIISIKDENECLNNKIISIKDENESLSNKIIFIKGKNDSLNSKVTSLENDNQALSTEIISTKDENEKLRSKVKTFINESKNITSQPAIMTQLEEDLARNLGEIDKLKEEKKTLMKTLQETKEYLFSKSAEFDELRGEYDNVLTESKSKANSYERELSHATSRLESLQKENIILKETVVSSKTNTATHTPTTMLGIEANVRTSNDNVPMANIITAEEVEKLKKVRTPTATLGIEANVRTSNDSVLTGEITTAEEVEKLKKVNDQLRRELDALNERNLATSSALEEARTKLNTVLNTSRTTIQTPSTANSSSMSSTLTSTNARVSKQKLKDKIEKLQLQKQELEDEVDQLRSNRGIIGSTEELEKQLQWMREQQQMTEFHNERLNKNYDFFVAENTELKEKLNAIESRLQKTGNDEAMEGSSVDSNVISREKFVQTEVNSGEVNRKKFFELKRENAVMKMELDALHAPAKKEAERLKVELEMMHEKNKKLWTELRRTQVNNQNDVSLMERNAQAANPKPCQECLEHKEMGSGVGFGSKVVLDVVVMRLKNTVYHLEKDKKNLERETETLKQHVEHYKRKSDEWKTKCHFAIERCKDDKEMPQTPRVAEGERLTETPTLSAGDERVLAPKLPVERNSPPKVSESVKKKDGAKETSSAMPPPSSSHVLSRLTNTREPFSHASNKKTADSTATLKTTKTTHQVEKENIKKYSLEDGETDENCKVQ